MSNDMCEEMLEQGFSANPATSMGRIDLIPVILNGRSSVSNICIFGVPCMVQGPPHIVTNTISLRHRVEKDDLCWRLVRKPRSSEKDESQCLWLSLQGRKVVARKRTSAPAGMALKRTHEP